MKPTVVWKCQSCGTLVPGDKFECPKCSVGTGETSPVNLGAALLPGEKIVGVFPETSAALQQFVLTTHRIRLSQRQSGRTQVTSMMLDQLDSCGFTSREHRAYLICGLAVGAIGMISALWPADDHGLSYFLTSLGVLLGILGIMLVLLYFGTRQQGISVTAGSTTISLNVGGSDLERAERFVSAIETAKNQRWLFGVGRNDGDSTTTNSV